jgi:hypothetical protein
MASTRIQLPDDIFRINHPGSRRTILTIKKNQERTRLEREDRKAKLELRARRKEEAGSGFQKELEKSASVDNLGERLM